MTKRHNVNAPAVVDTMAERDKEEFDDGDLKELEDDSSNHSMLKVIFSKKEKLF